MSVEFEASFKGDELTRQNDSPLETEQGAIGGITPENENIEGVVRDRHASCTSCTERSEERQRELNSALPKINETRKSVRDKRLTSKMQELKEQELAQRERKFKSAYEKWKTHVRDVRSRLKHKCSEAELYDMMDTVEKQESVLKEIYDNMRCQAPPNQEIRRNVDTCVAVTAELLKLMKVRSVEDELDFDPEAEKARLRLLLDNEYAKSIYGSTASRATGVSRHSKALSESASISVKRAEIAAQLAAKKAEAEIEAEIEVQRQHLKKLEHRRDIEVMEAQLKVYTEEESREKCVQCSQACSNIIAPSPPVSNTLCLKGQGTINETSLAQALQESMALTRLPVPEPSIFSGDPLKFIEWSTSFKALIERRCLNSTDRLFYLQKYISGDAKSALEGSFYRKDEQAYQEAWEKLNTRYGHSFVVQRAFREKLNRWPKIGAKEYVKLREFSDFLQSCSDAMPHVKGLQVLNDCEENQRMLVKLPDWVTSRWNRYVSEQLDQAKDYPGFGEFATFISKEARIACNPVSSLYALKRSDERANTFATSVKTAYTTRAMAQSSDADDSEFKDSREPKTTQEYDGSSVKCFCCGESHFIHKCQKLKGQPVSERKRFVLENKLCFACLRKGHYSKDCRNRATCALCKRRHPTSLHEDRPLADKSPLQQLLQVEESTSSLSCCVNEGEHGSTSMIIPVWLSSPNTESEILVYALLDTQSSHTFVDQEMCEKLHAETEPVKLRLSTMMGKDAIVTSQRVSGLKVRGLSSKDLICLPPAYSRDFIPLERAHIPTCDTARKWTHLAAVADEMPKMMDCGVGLVIGYDCSRALVPRQVIAGGDYEPYAIKTDLGWSIVGSASQCLNSKDVTSLCHRISAREREVFPDQGTVEQLVGDPEVKVVQVLTTEATAQVDSKGNYRGSQRGTWLGT